MPEVGRDNTPGSLSLSAAELCISPCQFRLDFYERSPPSSGRIALYRGPRSIVRRGDEGGGGVKLQCELVCHDLDPGGWRTGGSLEARWSHAGGWVRYLDLGIAWSRVGGVGLRGSAPSRNAGP